MAGSSVVNATHVRSKSSPHDWRRAPSALRRLLQHARPHTRYAALTLAFGALGFVLSFAFPWIIGSVVDTVVTSRSAPTPAGTDRLVWLTAAAAMTAVLHAVVVYGRGHFSVRLGHAIVVDLRRELFEHLQTLSLIFFTKQRTGAILSRLMQDVQEATSLIYSGVIIAALDSVQLIIAVVLLVAISWKLTLACAVLFPLYGLVFLLLNPRVRRATERVQDDLTRIAGDVAEQLSGQALIKTYTAEDREAKRFGDGVIVNHELVIEQSHEGHLVASSGEVLVHFGTTIVLGYGGWLAMHGELTAGTLTRFMGYVLSMFGPVRRVGELNVVYQSSLAAMNRVFALLEVQPAIREPRAPRRLPPARGHIRFESVWFRYPENTDEARWRLDGTAQAERRSDSSAPWILQDVCLEARPGELIAVVGPSGAGKTTLLSLLPRLYDATRGSVLVDGVDVRDHSLRALRGSIAIVQQETFIFSGTVRENLAYGRPTASEDDVMEAARAAHADEFIRKLPRGYDTVLGERGVNLSGGQRQRLSIARALLRDPRILILDEATSSLDAESEAVVQAALDRLMRSRTSFVIAHRLSTIRTADRIYVLEAGRFVEVGPHDKLVARGAAYARLVRNQAVAS